MKLLHLEIENFGKLSGFVMDFEDGLNILHEKNGWGKSTLAVFIKAMLYGLHASTRRGLDQNERKKYTPWQGGAYGGSLEFECQKGAFRVERFFAAKEADDEFRLFDLSTNKPSTAFSKELGVELFGIDADGFERSTYLSQRAIESFENGSVTTKLTGLLEDVNDMDSFDGAMARLDDRRKFYELKGGRGRLADLTQQKVDAVAELELCRGKLPLQEQLAKELADCREELAGCKAEQTRWIKLKQEVAVKKTRREELNRMQEEIAKQEARRREILSCFHEQTLPTDEELDRAKRLLEDYRNEQDKAQAYRPSESDKQAWEELKARYPKGIPAAEQAEALQGSINHFHTARSRAETVSVLPDTRDQLRFAKSGIPPQPLLDDAAEKAERAEKLRHRYNELATQPEPKKGSLSLLAIIIFAVAAIAGLLGLLLEPYRLPLLIAAGLLAVIGVGLLLLGRRSNTGINGREVQLQSVRNEIDTLQNAVHKLLEAYGMSRQPEEYRNALAELTLVAAHAREDALLQSKQKQQKSELQAKAEQLRSETDALLARIGSPALPKEPQEALFRIRTDIQEHRRLVQKQQANQAGLSEAEETLARLQEQIKTFLSRLTVKESNRPEDCLLQMQRLTLEHTDLLSGIRRRREQMRELTVSSGLSEDAPLPEEAELNAGEQQLEAKLQALTDRETSLKRQLERLTEQTQRIPELSDLVEQLTEEEKLARQNLSTLKKTAEFLERSKEALSTRYLDGMQKSFSAYLGVLQGDAASDAFMDTSLDISVREGGKSRALESFSRGSRDLFSFGARLALVRALFPEGETPFLLLDDPFVNLDEDHLSAVRTLLDSLAGEFQVLYYVCHEGRM